MTKRLASTLTLATALVVAAVLIPVGSASADVKQTPVTTGCPTGIPPISLRFLASQGPYQLPFRLDAAGNNDGVVCGRPVPEAARLAQCGADCPVPVLYLFRENDSPAQRDLQLGGYRPACGGSRRALSVAADGDRGLPDECRQRRLLLRRQIE